MIRPIDLSSEAVRQSPLPPAVSEIQRAPDDQNSSCHATPQKGLANYGTPRHLRGYECETPEQVLAIDFENEWELDVCAICLGQVESLDEAGRLPCTCTAVYHRDCVARWLLKNNSCPQCRHSADVPRRLSGFGFGGHGGSSCCSGFASSEKGRGAKEDPSSPKVKAAGTRSPKAKGSVQFELEDVAVMYFCEPPFHRDIRGLQFPEECAFQDPVLDGTEIWMQMQGSTGAVLAVPHPAATSEGAVALCRGLDALQGAWICSYSLSFVAFFHPEILLQSQEYTATTGVIWRLLDSEEPTAEPPCIVQRLFMVAVFLNQALRSFLRWVKGGIGLRTFIYLMVILLIMLSLMVGLQQICVDVSGSARCGWAQHDALMRRAVFYSTYR
mmetsp:Transcript_12405/g.29477  ORF Transcript_12405/g.29477 Transcript_12405/m.29477 type:complete len:385 (-) Transcript_12405:515-1669(-)